MSKSAASVTIVITRMPHGSYHDWPIRSVQARETSTQYIIPSLTSSYTGMPVRISKSTGREIGGDKYHGWQLKER